MTLRTLILNNFWLKFWSVALATVLWGAIHYSIEHDLGFKESDLRDVKHLIPQEFDHVPVAIVSGPQDPRVFNVSPKQVSVVTLGEESLLRGVSQKDIRVHVDLTDFRGPKAADIPLEADVPRDVTVLSIIPPSVSIEQVTK